MIKIVSVQFDKVNRTQVKHHEILATAANQEVAKDIVKMLADSKKYGTIMYCTTEEYLKFFPTKLKLVEG